MHDADINSALNHEAELVELPFGFRHFKLNKTGFFWNTQGVFDFKWTGDYSPCRFKAIVYLYILFVTVYTERRCVFTNGIK